MVEYNIIFFSILILLLSQDLAVREIVNGGSLCLIGSEVIFLLLVEVGVHAGEEVLDSAFAVFDFLEDCGILGDISLERLDTIFSVGCLARN